MIAKYPSAPAVAALVVALALLAWSGMKQVYFPSPPPPKIEQSDRPLIPLYEIRKQKLEKRLKKRRHRI